MSTAPGELGRLHLVGGDQRPQRQHARQDIEHLTP